MEFIEFLSDGYGDDKCKCLLRLDTILSVAENPAKDGTTLLIVNITGKKDVYPVAEPYDVIRDRISSAVLYKSQGAAK